MSHISSDKVAGTCSRLQSAIPAMGGIERKNQVLQGVNAGFYSYSVSNGLGIAGLEQVPNFRLLFKIDDCMDAVVSLEKQTSVFLSC